MTQVGNHTSRVVLRSLRIVRVHDLSVSGGLSRVSWKLSRTVLRGGTESNLGPLLGAINDKVFSAGMMTSTCHLKQRKRYRIRMRNASDDIHPIHLHRHSFELTKLAGISTSGVMKDVVIVGGYQEVEVDFTADNPA